MNIQYDNEILKEVSDSCLLCSETPCTSACPASMDVAGLIRSVRFNNAGTAAEKMPAADPCLKCSAPCMQKCLKGKISTPVQIPSLMHILAQKKEDQKTIEGEEPDLGIDFLGFHCINPFFLSSSVVGSNYEMISKAFDMGWGGVVYKTITSFPHDEVSPRFDAVYYDGNSFGGFKNLEESSEHTLQENIEILRRLKKDYPDRMVIASIMGQTEQDWEFLARQLTTAGIDALECNFSCPHMAYDGLGTDVGEHSDIVDQYVRAIKRGSDLPLIAKMSPHVSSMVPPAEAAVHAGADALATINTIKSILGIDPQSLSSGPDISGKTAVGGYSGKAVKPIALRFIYDLASSESLKDVPLSGIGGIESWKDAFDFLSLGCRNIQVTTAVMQYGYRIIDDMISGMQYYMRTHGIHKIQDLVGKALPNIVGTDELDRDTVCYPKFQTHRCIGCGRCYLSCYDGGHQAILPLNGAKVRMDAKKCVGCHLCLKVCPVGAIIPGTRVVRKK